MERKKNDIITDSTVIKRSLKDRFKELGLSYSMIEKDSVLRGRKGICKSSLSRYLNNNSVNGLSHENIIWLCIRYSIRINLQVDKLEYNEEKALLMLSKIF